MFNVLISADDTAWESEQRMSMPAERFLEHSGDEAVGFSAKRPDSIKSLERVLSLLMYEEGVNSGNADVVRIGYLRDIRMEGGEISFRFTETGRVDRQDILERRHRLQIARWEAHRTHWAIKDGEIPQDVLALVKSTPKQYDVVLSFAGEDRTYVEEVASFLEDKGVVVFYDKNEQASLWGKDLVEHFDSVFRNLGRYCVMFISRSYADKVWTSHERRSALARALEQRTEYLLPARFDETEIPGIRPTVGYVDLRSLAPAALGRLILEKLGRNPG